MASRILIKPKILVWKSYVNTCLGNNANIKPVKNSIKVINGIAGDIGNMFLPVASAIAATFFIHTSLGIATGLVAELSIYNGKKEILDTTHCINHVCMENYDSAGIWP